jgi:hypothetical protein
MYITIKTSGSFHSKLTDTGILILWSDLYAQKFILSKEKNNKKKTFAENMQFLIVIERREGWRPSVFEFRDTSCLGLAIKIFVKHPTTIKI